MLILTFCLDCGLKRRVKEREKEVRVKLRILLSSESEYGLVLTSKETASFIQTTSYATIIDRTVYLAVPELTPSPCSTATKVSPSK